jgi:hypothetical protein
MKPMTKIRAKRQGDRVEILVLVPRAALAVAGGRAPSDSLGDGSHVEQMTFFLNAREVATAAFGFHSPPDLLTGIALSGTEVGDRIAVTWRGSDGSYGGAELELS